ncbi:MAG: hypothetical protein DCF18_12395 [Cyanobium sp.]|nr:MAG: hypothetical protein DCF18_12395 [Cyanobium sp.]
MAPGSATDDGGCEEWLYLDEEVLVARRSSKLCLTCHVFRHHAGVNCTPLLTRRCQGWTKAMARQRGVASSPAGAAAQEPPGDQPG